MKIQGPSIYNDIQFFFFLNSLDVPQRMQNIIELCWPSLNFCLEEKRKIIFIYIFIFFKSYGCGTVCWKFL